MSEWQPIETAAFREWRPVPGHPGIEAHYLGDVRAGGRILRQYTSSRGYQKVTLPGRKQAAVHRLVALAHVPNPEGYREVNHLNGIKGDNLAPNLEWCTRSQNMKHAYAAGLHPGVRLVGADSPNFGRSGRKHCQSMAVRATFPDGREVDFESQGLAAAHGFSPSKISLCINGHRKTHGGATWMPLPDPPLQPE